VREEWTWTGPPPGRATQRTLWSIEKKKLSPRFLIIFVHTKFSLEMLSDCLPILLYILPILLEINYLFDIDTVYNTYFD
jgi:hypothetical protein